MDTDVYGGWRRGLWTKTCNNSLHDSHIVILSYMMDQGEWEVDTDV